MAIIGFSFLKFDAVNNEAQAKGQIEISHNVKIDNVQPINFNPGSGQSSEVLKISFTFLVGYGLDLGHIKVSGNVVYSDLPEIIHETIKGFQTDGKLNEMVNNEVSRFIYSKGIVKALDMSDNLGLPAPIPVVPQGMFDKKQPENRN